MIARALRDLRARAVRNGRRAPGEDRGITLVELLIAMTLTLILSGVLVAAVITSLNVASATSDNLKSSVDVRLVSSYLARDAQGAGGTDPDTVQKSPDTGVSNTAGDWGGCEQAGATMVARFKWVDRVDIRTERKVTVTWAINGNDLFRQYCEDGATKNIVRLGRTLTSAVATCDTTCSGTPTSVSLTISGNNGKSNYTTTMSASLRSRGQDFPTEESASTVTFLALGHGAPTPCTNVALGSATAYVIGDAVVNINAMDCDANALTPGSSSIVHPTFGSPAVAGVTSLTASIVDPLAATPVPTQACSGSNPTLGTPGVYPDKLTITAGDGAVTFASGTYVFCKGLEIESGASVVSDGGVFLYLKGGTLTIDPNASVELSAIRTGIEQRNILLWVATKQTVSIGTGNHITRLGGTIYAPTSDVVLTGDTNAAAINVGVLIAATVTVNSAVPIARFGPIPTLSITPTFLENASAGEEYEAQLALAGSGASEMVNPRWSAVGLSPFTIDATTGLISGTASCSVALTPHVRVVDDTGLAVSANYTLVVGSDLTLADPGAYVRGTVALKASLVDTCGGPGTSVTIQYALSGEDADGDGEPDWVDMCTTTTAVNSKYLCSWVTTDTTKYTDGTAYDLRAIATLPSGATSESPTISSVIVDNTTPDITLNSPGASPLHGTVTLIADAVDYQTGVKVVKFGVDVVRSSVTMHYDLCSKTAPYDPANQSLYSCEWNTTEAPFTPDFLGTESYVITAAASDYAGNWHSSSLTRTVNNSGSSISVVSPGSYIRSTVTVGTNPYVPSPATVTSVKIQYKFGAGAWTDICTATTSPWSCSWNTSVLSDGAYSLQAIMVDSRSLSATSASITTNVDNAVVYGVDVQAYNGTKSSYDKRKQIWTTKTNSLGKLDIAKIDANNKPLTYDRIVFTYSKTMSTSSIISGWDGTARKVWIRVRDKGVAGNYVNTNDTLEVCASYTSGSSCTGLANLGWVKFPLDSVAGGKTAVFEATIVHTVSGGKSVFTVAAAGLQKFGKGGDVKGANVGVLVWTPSVNAKDTVGSGNSCSNRPTPETGTNDKDF